MFNLLCLHMLRIIVELEIYRFSRSSQAAGTSGASIVPNVSVSFTLYPAAVLAAGTGQMGILPGE